MPIKQGTKEGKGVPPATVEDFTGCNKSHIQLSEEETATNTKEGWQSPDKLTKQNVPPRTRSDVVTQNYYECLSYQVTIEVEDSQEEGSLNKPRPNAKRQGMKPSQAPSQGKYIKTLILQYQV